MAWTRTRIKLHERRNVRGERSFAAVEFVHQQLVEPEIIDKSEAVVRRQVDGVTVRAFLALGVGPVSMMLHERRRFAETVEFPTPEAEPVVLREAK